MTCFPTTYILIKRCGENMYIALVYKWCPCDPPSADYPWVKLRILFLSHTRCLLEVFQFAWWIRCGRGYFANLNFSHRRGGPVSIIPNVSSSIHLYQVYAWVSYDLCQILFLIIVTISFSLSFFILYDFIHYYYLCMQPGHTGSRVV